MKKIIAAFGLCLLVCSISKTVNAQDNQRYKLQLSVQHQGKTVTTGLSSAVYGVNRYEEETLPDSTAASSAKSASRSRESFYLTISLPSINKELLQLIASSKNRYSGSITITDTYGKEPVREIAYKEGSFNNVSQSFSTYSNDYGSASFNIIAAGLSIDGIEMQP